MGLKMLLCLIISIGEVQDDVSSIPLLTLTLPFSIGCSMFLWLELPLLLRRSRDRCRARGVGASGVLDLSDFSALSTRQMCSSICCTELEGSERLQHACLQTCLKGMVNLSAPIILVSSFVALWG